MPIITISRGSYSHGKEVAEKVAQKLGYECISREALLKASAEFNIPEIKLARALHDAPAFFERFTFAKEKYVAYIRAALLSQVQQDNVVYHGLAGPFLLQGVPNVLKVRIIADPEDRLAEEMKREHITFDAAVKKMHKDDADRRSWGMKLFGVDTGDPSLYDQVLHIRSLTVDNAVELIAAAVKFPCFKTTPQAKEILRDMAIAARVKAALVEEFPTADVLTEDGKVVVVAWGSARGSLWESEKDETTVIARVQQLAKDATGAEVEVRYQLRVI